MELLSKYVDCVLCKQLLNMPVLLPCKHSICKHHENEAAEKIDGTRIIDCAYCGKSFEIPSEGFPQTISTIYVDANQDNLIKELKSMFSDILQQIQQALGDYKEVNENSNGRIHRVLNEIRKKIDHIAEVSVYNNDIYTKVMEKIDHFEKYCKLRSSSLEPNMEFLQEVRDKMCVFDSDIERLWIPPITHETMLKWRHISDKLLFHLKELHSEYNRFNEELFIKHIDGFNFMDLSDNSSSNLETLNKLFIFV